MGLEAPPRWDLVHARAVSAAAEILMHRRDAQKVLRKALRPEWPGFDEAPGWAGDARGGGVNNAERAVSNNSPSTRPDERSAATQHSNVADAEGGRASSLVV